VVHCEKLAVAKHPSEVLSGVCVVQCLNMAGLYNLPHIFVVENNKWAIGMAHMRATSVALGDEEPFIYKKVRSNIQILVRS
jgi:TPP-dependent pyruvate/acetoin dehydrogenase alpha subunit